MYHWVSFNIIFDLKTTLKMKIGIIVICALVSTILIARNQGRSNLLFVGQQGPDFSLISDSNESVSSKAFRGQPLVLYFFPKANTPG